MANGVLVSNSYDAVTYALIAAFPDLIRQNAKPIDPRTKTDPLSVKADEEYDEETNPELLRKRMNPSYRVYG